MPPPAARGGDMPGRAENPSDGRKRAAGRICGHRNPARAIGKAAPRMNFPTSEEGGRGDDASRQSRQDRLRAGSGPADWNANCSGWGMRRSISDWAARYRCMDWGTLYLRIFLGGSIFFHNVWKMQNYNEIIGSYPSLFGSGGATSFVVASTAEVLMAVLLLLGFRVRLAAAAMAAGMLWLFFADGIPSGETALVYAAVYAALVITGGGLFSFDGFAAPRKTANENR